LLVFSMASLTLSVCVGTAVAEHRASRATFNAIDRLLTPSARTLDDHLASVEVNSFGPYALALESGGQGYRELLKHKRGHWRNIAVVSESTGLQCSVAPRAVTKDLHLLRYVPAHRCDGRR
jgi:hypothetical protein